MENPKKKKVAVFLNGWNSENAFRYISGLNEHTPDFSIDYYVFLCHAIYSSTEVEIQSMSAIFDLPDLSGFDAAILFTPGLNFTDTINHLTERLESSGIPIISIGLPHPGFYYIGINNYTGMRELCDHIIEKHGVKRPVFVAGSMENEDSNARLSALRDSMCAHGMTLREEDIVFTNWETTYVMNEFPKRYSSEELPDAFVCANDLLAEAVSYVITDLGFPVESTIITGFDFLDEGQNFYPSIASVDQRYDYVGKTTVDVLTRIFSGDKVPSEQLVDCLFQPGESCGCLTCRDDDNRRRRVVRGLPRKLMITDSIEGRFHAMEKEIIQSVDYEDLKDKLSKLFCFTTGLEGDTFYIMLDPRIADFSLSELETFPRFCYGDVMDTFVAKRNHRQVPGGIIPTSQLLPDEDLTGANHIYFFVPIYYETFVCGYIVMTDQVDWLSDRFFHACEKRFNRALVSYRRNMQLTALNTKLSMLMEKDSLTFVKNRTAYDRYVKNLEAKMVAGDFEPFAVVCFDINFLKEANDMFGHEAGDEYIKKCCKLICNTFKHSPVFRIGGDEFVAIAVHDDYLNRYEYLTAMRNHMAMLDVDTGLSAIERISVASGLADSAEQEGEDYSSIFRRADTRMYENKRKMKGGRSRQE